MQGAARTPQVNAPEHKVDLSETFLSAEHLFGFLRDERPPALLAKDILEVTQAEPDVPRQVVHALHKVLSPFFEANPELRGEFNAIKGILINPEALVHVEKSFYRGKTTQLSAQEEATFFKTLDNTIQRVISFNGPFAIGNADLPRKPLCV